MAKYKRGHRVFIRGTLFGSPLKVVGEVVGFVDSDFYNVLIKTGINEGKIIKYKYWELCPKDSTGMV